MLTAHAYAYAIRNKYAHTHRRLFNIDCNYFPGAVRMQF